MSNEPKQGFLSKEITRRQFMKISGKSLAGFTLTASMLKLFGCTQEQVDNGQVTVVATPPDPEGVLPDGLLVVNADICVGCLRCETNCTTVNDGKVSYYNSRIKVTRNLMYNQQGIGMYVDLDDGMSWTYYPDTCRQCEPPLCADICPVDAIYSDIRGVKLVNEDVCIGCEVCKTACPWDMIQVNKDINKAIKCNCCYVCVEGCPTGALTVIPWDAVAAAAQPEWRG